MFNRPHTITQSGSACSRREFLAATAVCGMAGAGVTRALGANVPAGDAQPAAFPLRECYCPAHFGNSYEAMGSREMAAYLAELKWMGFNRYGDWITTTDICNPYTSDAFWDLAKEQLDRKKRAFQAAQDLGLGLNLIVTPNHVYLDQLRPHYAAVKTKKIFGQLVCPSHPEARKLILDNFARWFGDLADAGLRFSAFTAFAYDYGGCDCEKCRPWILTFARLMKEVHEVARRRHPQIQPWFCSWWWTPAEHAQFNAWAAKEAPGWLKGMTMHIEYGQTRPKDVEVPAGCRKLAFVHVGYGDQRDIEVYGRVGPVIAPQRLPQTLAELRQRGFEGFQAYSEGVFDDCNKTLLAGIGSGQFSDATAALGAYAGRYFRASGARAGQWANWLGQWGNRKSVALPAAAEELGRLAEGAAPGWRLEQWRFKLQFETLDRKLSTTRPNEWTAERLAMADEFFALQERLYREVYRLGPVRHVLNPRFMPPAWVDSWRKATTAAAAAKPQSFLPQQ